MPTKLLLIRHAESIKNSQNIFGDSSRIFPLTSRGIEQANFLAKQLKQILYLQDTIILTDSEHRAIATASIISQILQINSIMIPQLNPIHAGDLSGITEKKAQRLFSELMKKKDLYRRGLLNGYEISYPGGENVREFQERVLNGLFPNIKKYLDKTLVVISHQSTITAILSYMSAPTGQEEFYEYYHVDLCSISEAHVETNGKYSLIRINSIEH